MLMNYLFQKDNRSTYFVSNNVYKLCLYDMILWYTREKRSALLDFGFKYHTNSLLTPKIYPCWKSSWTPDYLRYFILIIFVLDHMHLFRNCFQIFLDKLFELKNFLHLEGKNIEIIRMLKRFVLLLMTKMWNTQTCR